MKKSQVYIYALVVPLLVILVLTEDQFGTSLGKLYTVPLTSNLTALARRSCVTREYSHSHTRVHARSMHSQLETMRDLLVEKRKLHVANETKKKEPG